MFPSQKTQIATELVVKSAGLAEEEVVKRQGGPKMEALSLGPWASQRRKNLLELLDSLEPRLTK
jgi:hypothetical protein